MCDGLISQHLEKCHSREIPYIFGKYLNGPLDISRKVFV